LPAAWSAAALSNDTDPTRLDIALIHHFLRQVLALGRAISRSIHGVAPMLIRSPFGVYGDGAQIGFARIVTTRRLSRILADVLSRGGTQCRSWTRLIESILAHRRCKVCAAGAGDQGRQELYCAAVLPNYARTCLIWSGSIRVYA